MTIKRTRVICWPIFRRLPMDEWTAKGAEVRVVNTTSKARADWQSDLSPFKLGPCSLYSAGSSEWPYARMMSSKIMENAWQFSKVYPEHLNRGKITLDYWEWAFKGWASDEPQRYPMGKGRKPEFSLWEGERLGYVEARKRIYGPLYAEAVQKTKGWKRLKRIFEEPDIEPESKYLLIVLLDFDAYDHRARGMTLTDVLNDPNRKMGHAFVLNMLLTDDPALKQMELRK